MPDLNSRPPTWRDLLPQPSGTGGSELADQRLPKAVRYSAIAGLALIAGPLALDIVVDPIAEKAGYAGWHLPDTAADRELNAAALKPSIIATWEKLLRTLGTAEEDLNLIRDRGLYYRILSTENPEYLGWYAHGRALFVSSTHVADCYKLLRASGISSSECVSAVALMTFPVAVHELEHARTRRKSIARFGFDLPGSLENETLSVCKELRGIAEVWPEVRKLGPGGQLVSESLLEPGQKWRTDPDEILRESRSRWGIPSVFLTGRDLTSLEPPDCARFLLGTREFIATMERDLGKRMALERLDRGAGLEGRFEIRRQLSEMRSPQYYRNGIESGRAWLELLDRPDAPSFFRSVQQFYREEFDRIREEQRALNTSNRPAVAEFAAEVSRKNEVAMLELGLAICLNAGAGGKTTHDLLAGSRIALFEFRALPEARRTVYTDKIKEICARILNAGERENSTNIVWSGEALETYLAAADLLGRSPAVFAVRGLTGSYLQALEDAKKRLSSGDPREAMTLLVEASRIADTLRTHGSEVNFESDFTTRFNGLKFVFTGYSAGLMVGQGTEHPLGSAEFAPEEILGGIKFIKERSASPTYR